MWEHEGFSGMLRELSQLGAENMFSAELWDASVAFLRRGVSGLLGCFQRQEAAPFDLWPSQLWESEGPPRLSGSVPTPTGLLVGPVLTSLVERLLWASRLRMASVLMALYGKKRSLTCSGREGGEGYSAVGTSPGSTVSTRVSAEQEPCGHCVGGRAVKTASMPGTWT